VHLCVCCMFAVHARGCSSHPGWECVRGIIRSPARLCTPNTHAHTVHTRYIHTCSLIAPAAPHHHTTTPPPSSTPTSRPLWPDSPSSSSNTHTLYIYYIHTLYTHTKYKKYIFTHYIHTRSLLAPAAPHHHTTSAIHPHQSSLVAGLTIKLITHVVPILPATQLLSQQVRC
jgi:hypothetical protein